MLQLTIWTNQFSYKRKNQWLTLSSKRKLSVLKEWGHHKSLTTRTTATCIAKMKTKKVLTGLAMDGKIGQAADVGAATKSQTWVLSGQMLPLTDYHLKDMIWLTQKDGAQRDKKNQHKKEKTWINVNNTVFRKTQVELTGKATGTRTGMAVNIAVVAHKLKKSIPNGKMPLHTIWMMTSQIWTDDLKEWEKRWLW